MNYAINYKKIKFRKIWLLVFTFYVEKIKFDSLTKEEQYNVKYKHRKTAAVFNAATAERQQFWKTC